MINYTSRTQWVKKRTQFSNWNDDTRASPLSKINLGATANGLRKMPHEWVWRTRCVQHNNARLWWFKFRCELRLFYKHQFCVDGVLDHVVGRRRRRRRVTALQFNLTYTICSMHTIQWPSLFRFGNILGEPRRPVWLQVSAFFPPFVFFAFSARAVPAFQRKSHLVPRLLLCIWTNRVCMFANEKWFEEREKKWNTNRTVACERSRANETNRRIYG